MASSGLAIEMMVAFGAVLLDALGDLLGDLEVDGQQLLAAREGAVRARLARHAGGVDDELRALERRVVLGAYAADVGADGGGALGDVEALALGHRLLLADLLALRRVVGVDEGRRVGEADLAREAPLDDLLGEDATDVPAADETDLVEHQLPPFVAPDRRRLLARRPVGCVKYCTSSSRRRRIPLRHREVEPVIRAQNPPDEAAHPGWQE
jgi:hypothetical protein